MSTLLDLQLKLFLHPTQTNSAKTELLCLLKDANEESSHSLSVSSPSHESDKRPNKCFCYLSKLSYRHRLLISTRSGKNPVMIGPIMIHYRKTFHTYVFFATTLVGLRHELIGLRAFGTDGEKALADAFSHEFHYAVHLTCFIHCRWNIKSQLHLLGYPECASKEVLEDIFGLWTPLMRKSSLISWRFWKRDGMKLRRCMVHNLGSTSGSLETK